MTVQWYDSEYQNTGSGVLPFVNLSGQITIDTYQQIGDDLLASGVAPQDFPPGGNPAADWVRVITCYPFVRITSGLESMPFISAPEPRYKVGSYSYLVGKDVVVNEDGTVTTYPYYSKPEYLIYERNYIKPFRFAQIKQYLSVVPDAVFYDVSDITPNPAAYFYLTSFYFGSNALDNGYGISLHLAEGLTADLVINYTWGSLQLDISPTVPTIIFAF